MNALKVGRYSLPHKSELRCTPKYMGECVFAMSERSLSGIHSYKVCQNVEFTVPKGHWELSSGLTLLGNERITITKTIVFVNGRGCPVNNEDYETFEEIMQHCDVTIL